MPAPTPSLTPKMNHVHYVAPPAGIMVSTGPLKCLDTQSSFDHFLGLHPTMIRIIQRNK